MPRSGTSLIGQFLKNSGVGLSGGVEPNREHVRIYPELHPGDVPAQFQLLEQIDAVLSQSEWQGLARELIDERLLSLLREIWRAGAPSSGVPDEGYERFGLKNPLAELFYDNYHSALGEQSPLWVYCVRDPLSVYESTLHAMGGFGDIEPKAFKRRFESSLAAAEGIPAAEKRVVPVDLWAADAAERMRQARSLLNFLEVEWTSRSENFLKRWPSINRRPLESKLATKDIQRRLLQFERYADKLRERIVALSVS